jgi:hypothetical protein
LILSTVEAHSSSESNEQTRAIGEVVSEYNFAFDQVVDTAWVAAKKCGVF